MLLSFRVNLQFKAELKTPDLTSSKRDATLFLACSTLAVRSVRHRIPLAQKTTLLPQI